MSKTLPILNGSFAIIDDDDFERAIKFRWYLDSKGYAKRNIRRSDGYKTIQFLSRFIMDAAVGIQVDHINGNKLDNRKSELRLCTHQQNN